MLRVVLLLCFTLFSFALSAQTQPYDTRPWDITKIKNGKYRFKSDTLRIRGNVRELKENGEWIFERKNSNGKWYVSEERNYWRGELNGQYFGFDKNGDTTVAGNYHKGKQTGVWKFYRYGTMTDKVSYDAQGNFAGEQLSFTDGWLSTRYYYTDSAHCYVWEYFRHGQVSRRGEFVGGKYSGTWYSYNAAGKKAHPADTLPILLANYRDGELHGQSINYSVGQPVIVANYSNGMLDSVQRYYVDGVLAYERNYNDGRLDGSQRSFYPSGKPYTEMIYRDNKNIASHVYDSVSGKVVESKYITGTRLDSIFYYTRDGQLVYSRVALSDDENTHEDRRYYENGMRKDSCRTLEYTRMGEYKSWHANGKVHVVSHHNKRGYCGTLDVWNEKGVHVVHALPSGNRDTVPEQVWSDRGVRLNPGTKAYHDQLDKYLVSSVFRYQDSVFYLNGVVITAMHLPGDHMPRQATQVEVGDSVSTNNRIAPAFPGGVRAFQNYLMKNILYPEKEKEEGKSGSVWITFTVNTDSTISDVYPLKVVSGAPGLDTEAMRVIEMMPKWSPALKRGKAYKSSCVVQVRFELL